MGNYKNHYAHNNDNRYDSHAGKQSQYDKYGTEEFCKYRQSQRNGGTKPYKIIEVILHSTEMNEFIVSMACDQNAKGYT